MSSQLKLITNTILTTPQTLRRLLTPYSDELLSWKPADDVWSIKETIGHLVAADQYAFAARINLMLHEDHPPLPGWDMEGIAAQRADNQRALHELIDEMTVLRAEAMETVSVLSEAQLAKTGDHRIGTLTVNDFVTEWAYHDMSHLKQIADNIRAHLLPQMSPNFQEALIRMESDT